MAIDTAKVNERTDRMCGRITGYNTLVGSWTRDVLRPIAHAFEEEKAYYEDEMGQRFVRTATGDKLDVAVAAENGPERTQAKKAAEQVTITGQNGSLITTGMKVKSDTVSYVVMEDKTIVNSSTKVLVECSEAGIIGNCSADSINKFGESYAGLTSVTNEAEFTTGAEKEEDESYRARALEEIRKPAGSWNKYAFENKAKEVEGIDLALCIPPVTAEDKGSIRLIMTDSSFTQLQQAKLDEAKTHILDEILSDITINTETIVERTVDIIIDAERHPDFDIVGAEAEVKENIDGYFDYLVFKTTSLLYHNMSDLLKDFTNSIYKLSDLKIDGDRVNLVLNENQRLKRGTVTFNWI